MRDSKLARPATSLVMLARGPSQSRTRRLRPVTRLGRGWAAAVAASLIVPAALAMTATTGPALASTAPLVITTTTPLTATAGSAFEAKLHATGGTKPYSWSLADGTVLPAGLKLRKSSGVISGTTTMIGSDSFTVRVTDAEVPAASATKNMTLNVVTSMTGGTFQVGSDPDAIAFGGTNAWVADA